MANAATFLYAMGFFAMLLGNILFLTGVWHYSILRAGLAVTPGPLVVAAVSGPAGRMAARVGFRRVLAGRVRRASLAGLVWYATRVGLQPDYLGVWLPATLVTGLGIGLTFPVLSAAAVSSLHPERFAVGSAVNQTARQVGGALGVALLVVILGTPSAPGGPASASTTCGGTAAAMAGLAGLLCLLLTPGPRAPPAPAPTPARRTPPGRVTGACGSRPGRLKGARGRLPARDRRVGRHPATQGVVPDRSGRPRRPTSPEEIMDQPTEPDADTEAAEQADAGHDHAADRPRPPRRTPQLRSGIRPRTTGRGGGSPSTSRR